jgi:hypothetical protein
MALKIQPRLKRCLNVMSLNSYAYDIHRLFFFYFFLTNDHSVIAQLFICHRLLGCAILIHILSLWVWGFISALVTELWKWFQFLFKYHTIWMVARYINETVNTEDCWRKAVQPTLEISYADLYQSDYTLTVWRRNTLYSMGARLVSAVYRH